MAGPVRQNTFSPLLERISELQKTWQANCVSSFVNFSLVILGIFSYFECQYGHRRLVGVSFGLAFPHQFRTACRRKFRPSSLLGVAFAVWAVSYKVSADK